MQSRVYLITNLVNNKRYVGSTKFSLEERWSGHCYDAFDYESPMRLHQAMRKYGKEQFKIELLEECESREHAYEREGQLIRELGTHVSLGTGYNVTFGKGGATRGMTGKKHSEATKRKMSASQRGRRHSSSSRAKMSQTRTGMRQPWKWVSIVQVDDAGNVIAVHQSFDDAAAAAGGGRSHIWLCCQGKRKHARGYRWRYASKNLSVSG